MEDLARFYQQILRLLTACGRMPEPLAQLVLTPKWAVVQGTGVQCGQAFRFGGEHAVHGGLDFGRLLSELRPLLGRPLDALVESLLAREGLCARVFCLAALNALSSPLCMAQALSDRGWRPLAAHALPFLRATDKVVCVGYGCLIGEVLSLCPQIHVTDMRPRADLESIFLGEGAPSGPDGVIFHDVSEQPGLLAGADVVLITGCTLANGTWRLLLDWSAHARVVGLFGPSAALAPEVLRASGFRYVTSSRITDPGRFAQNLRRPLSDPLAGGCAQGYTLLL